MPISILAAVKDYIRTVREYPRVLILADGECLCRNCARSEYRQIVRAVRWNDRTGGWLPVGVQPHYEGSESCAHCSADIIPAYTD